MHTPRINATLAAALLVLVSTDLVSAAGKPSGARATPDQGSVAMHLFARIDSNKDGQITREEAQAAGGRFFDQLDANKDGELTLQEAEAGARAIRDEELQARFKALDANADKRLSLAESKLPPRFFDQVDGNKDHAISPEEFQVIADTRTEKHDVQFKQADENHDGKITRNEAVDAAQQRFARVDANQDGVITREELDARLSKTAKGRAQHAPKAAAPH
jgi:Ca2+-binding EF-hand superfamily protein